MLRNTVQIKSCDNTGRASRRIAAEEGWSGGVEEYWIGGQSPRRVGEEKEQVVLWPMAHRTPPQPKPAWTCARTDPITTCPVWIVLDRTVLPVLDLTDCMFDVLLTLGRPSTIAAMDIYRRKWA
jgi:hypothetical protein